MAAAAAAVSLSLTSSVLSRPARDAKVEEEEEEKYSAIANLHRTHESKSIGTREREREGKPLLEDSYTVDR